MKIVRISLALFFGLSQSAFSQGAAQQLIQIGAAAAVAGGVTALAPQAGSAGRILSSGKTVFANDKISTDARGRLQVLFRDETVFTLGPDTEIVIDEFIYNPFDRSGEVLSTSVNKGTFRFVSGKVARKRPSAMKVKLPTGTIGIRGTIAGGTIFPDGSILIALLGPGAENTAGERPGSIEVTSAGKIVTLSRPGFATIIRPGQPPTTPFRMNPVQLAQLNTKPKAESGAGDPDGTEQDAKKTGGMGEAKTIVKATGIKQQRKQGDDQVTLNGAQSASSGVFSWADLRAGIQTGTGNYEAGTSGRYTCSGGTACSTPLTGILALHFEVNFGAKTFGGGGGDHIAFEAGAPNGVCGVAGVTCGGGGNVEATIPSTSFAALNGDAILTIGTDFTPGGTNGSDFNGTTLQFKENGHKVEGKLVYTSSVVNLSGTTFTGSATAPCISGACPQP